MIDFLKLFVHVLVSPFKTQARVEAEIILLRHQLNVLRRRGPPPSHRHVLVGGESACERLLRGQNGSAQVRKSGFLPGLGR